VWAVLGAYVLLPAIETFKESFVEGGAWSLEHYSDFFSVRTWAGEGAAARWTWTSGSRAWSPGLQALYGSLFVSLMSVVFAGAVGVPLAFFLERNHFPGRSVLAPLMFLPLTLPPIVGVVSFDLLFSESGMLPRGLALLFGHDSPPVYLTGKGGIVAIHAYSFFPFFYLLVSNAVREVDASLIEASRGMGDAAWRTFFKVELPMLVPALSGAALMVFMLSMASFSAPLLFDVDGMYLSTHIYNLKNQNLLGEAYTATSLFATASLGMLLVLRYLRGSKRYQSVGKGVPRRRHRVVSPFWKAFATGGGILVFLLVLLPHLTIFLWSMTRDGSWTYQILPPEYTLENYRRLLGADRSEVVKPVVDSLWMAGLATAANVVVGIAAAFVLKSGRLRGRAATDLLVMLPWALPGTVIAINLIVTFNHPTPLALGFNLANSVFLLPIAYFIRNLPLVVRPLVAAWERTGEDVEEAARVLGAGRFRMLMTVSLPLVFPSLVAGTLLAFVTALGEFVASAILYTPRNKPIAMAIYSEFHSGAYGICSAYGVLLIVLIATVMLLGRKQLQGSGVG
jgi:iron(III) transport system permease protein